MIILLFGDRFSGLLLSSSAVSVATQTPFISNIVLCEMVWVLRGKPYQYPQSEILKIIELLLQSSKLEFVNRTVIYKALKFNKLGKADFADYLIGAANHFHECSTTVTFDRKLKDEKWYRVLD